MATLVTESSSTTRPELTRCALALAGTLRARGVRPGDRVLVALPDTVDLVAAVLALIHLDASIVLVNERQNSSERRRTAGVARATWALTTMPEDLGAGVTTVPVAVVPADFVDACEPAGEVCFDRWSDRTDAIITWSSGSTGIPKGVVRAGRVFLDDLARTAARMGYRADDVLLPLVPLAHFYGLTLLLMWWRTGCTLVLSGGGRLDQALRLGGRYGATVVDATPATYHSIARLSERSPTLRSDLATVRLWCVGGSPLGAAFAR